MQTPTPPMKFSLLFLLPLLLMGAHEGEAEQCGVQAGGALCPNRLCCSKWGYCGSTDAYCGPGNCQSQCPSPSPPPPPLPSPPPPPPSPTPAEQCGVQAGGALCPNRLCCSKWGYCGSTDAYCGPDNCQSQCPPPPPPPPPPPSPPPPPPSPTPAEQCGVQAGGALCPNRLCCSKWGYCGSTDAYCAPGNCQSQCPPPSPPPPPPSPTPPPPPPLPPCPGGSDLSDIFPKELFEKFLLHRDNPACPARGFYTYEAFIEAARAFPDFGHAGDNTTRKREIAAFFGQTSHETTGGWAAAPDGPYAWGYCFKAEVGADATYCDPNPRWPCVPGKKYYGRGPIQLSYNYNYGQAGEALGLDLLSNPELVENDPVVSFKTAIWFWMTEQPPKPSCHEVMIGAWVPTPADISAGRVPGYGMCTNIINGGLECGGSGPDARVESRIGFYKRYCDIYGISYGDRLDCYGMQPFGLILTRASA